MLITRNDFDFDFGIIFIETAHYLMTIFKFRRLQQKEPAKKERERERENTFYDYYEIDGEKPRKMCVRKNVSGEQTRRENALNANLLNVYSHRHKS